MALKLSPATQAPSDLLTFLEAKTTRTRMPDSFSSLGVRIARRVLRPGATR